MTYYLVALLPMVMTPAYSNARVSYRTPAYSPQSSFSYAARRSVMYSPHYQHGQHQYNFHADNASAQETRNPALLHASPASPKYTPTSPTYFDYNFSPCSSPQHATNTSYCLAKSGDDSMNAEQGHNSKHGL
jgi:hypothetical protein